MASLINMPEIAAGTENATIQTWLVQEGDKIDEGRAIVEIETEKATVEYAAEASGVLVEIIEVAGSLVDVGAPIALLATEGQTADEARAETVLGSRSTGKTQTKDDSTQLPEDENQLESTGEAQQSDFGTPQIDQKNSTRLFSSPIVRKLAREHGIDLSHVNGTGPSGRIVRRDIDALLTDQKLPSKTSESNSATPSPDFQGGASAPQNTHANTGFTDIPHSQMRRRIAQRLIQSKNEIPHFYLVADCVVDDLLDLRTQINAAQNVRVSINDFVLKAAACAFQDVPDMNGIWTDNAIRKFDSLDIALAVSIPNGLVTPVLRNVDQKSLTNISKSARDASERAHAGNLRPSDLQGGSFTISNLGMYGVREFSAIINPPHSSILAVGAATKQPIVQSSGEIGAATVMRVTLSVDHRAIDGALAAKWLKAFQERIEYPLSIIV
jgi:pyruvate dehydrogenase E2 component (dihydrolipoamide acetyltransferase)